MSSRALRLDARALVVEPSFAVAGSVRRTLESAGLSVATVPLAREALSHCEEESCDLVFIGWSSSSEAEALCRELKKLWPLLPVVVFYPSEVEDPSAHALRLGADAFLVAPLTRANVLSTSQLLLRLTRMLKEKAEGAVEPPDEVALESAAAPSGLDDFKRALMMELRRSHRYKTPVCLLIAALDGPPPPPDEAFWDKAQSAMLAALRDIDLVARLSDGRFLILLPQTGREGGLSVAVRLQHCLGSPSPLDGPTASVGVGFCHPQASEGRVGLTALMKHAQKALARAREQGGNRVEAALPGPSRKERILLT